MPGFLGFTGFKIGAFHPDILMPINEYAKLYRLTRSDKNSFDTHNPYNNTYNIPKNRLMIGLASGITRQNRQIVKNRISAIVDNSKFNIFKLFLHLVFRVTIKEIKGQRTRN